jgi:putative membrane protein
MRRLAAGACILAARGSPLAAHPGERHGAAAIGWTISPEVIIPLAMALALYLAGLWRMRRRSRAGRAALERRAWLFLAGWTTLAGALVSPLHAAGEASFTMHMIEHELIMLVAAVLLVLGRPGPVLLWGLPRSLRQLAGSVARWQVWRELTRPITATALQAASLVIWHMPALFDRALDSEAWHVAQHLSFIVTALLFWWAMLPRVPSQADRLTAAICLFVTSMVGGGLGALMALDNSPWYSGYARMGMTPFGLTPAEDQQLAGLIMWVPGGLFHLAAALILLARALGSAPKRLDDGVAGRRQAA